MARALDKNYYPMPFPGGSSIVQEQIEYTEEGKWITELHEFYNESGKVIFYWKIKRDPTNKIIHIRVKVPNRPAEPLTAYVGFDALE